MDKILSKNHPLITKSSDDFYTLNVFDYIDELKWLVKRATEKEEIPIGINIVLNHILNLLQLMNPKGTSVELSEEMLND